VPRATLHQVDPRARSYSGGPVAKMVGEMKRYFDDLRERLAKMSDAEREELAKRTEGMPMPVPPPAVPPKWTVKAAGKNATIAGRKAELYEVYRDGELYQERWIAPEPIFGADLDWAEYARWSRQLEASFQVGMGGSTPEGKEIDDLDRRGVELRSVLVGESARASTEITKIEKRDVPDSTFTLPVDYTLRGAQTL
jgi:hypothetical protein